jgi:hypothetical protein
MLNDDISVSGDDASQRETHDRYNNVELPTEGGRRYIDASREENQIGRPPKLCMLNDDIFVSGHDVSKREMRERYDAVLPTEGGRRSFDASRREKLERARIPLSNLDDDALYRSGYDQRDDDAMCVRADENSSNTKAQELRRNDGKHGYSMEMITSSSELTRLVTTRQRDKSTGGIDIYVRERVPQQIEMKPPVGHRPNVDGCLDFPDAFGLTKTPQVEKSYQRYVVLPRNDKRSPGQLSGNTEARTDVSSIGMPKRAVNRLMDNGQLRRQEVISGDDAVYQEEAPDRKSVV